MTPIQEHQAFEYEATSATLFQSLIHMWFPKYFIWKVKRRYKRYLGGMEYKKIRFERNMDMMFKRYKRPSL